MPGDEHDSHPSRSDVIRMSAETRCLHRVQEATSEIGLPVDSDRC